MQDNIIRTLNKLNQDFYQTVANDFSDSRQYFWQGWQRIPEYLKQNNQRRKKIQVLDIACGNARFAQFLKKDNVDFNYCGLDNSSNLLQIAQETIIKNNIDGQLFQFDLITNYLKNKTIIWPFMQKFDLIVVFGLTHHLPSFNLRLDFFKSLNGLLNINGLVVISNWQFTQDKRFNKNILNWEKIKNNPKINLCQKVKLKNLLKILENNDYLLDWRKKEKIQKNKVAIRYCYSFDKETSENIFKTAGYQIIDSFLADGKSQVLNRYFVLKKAD